MAHTALQVRCTPCQASRLCVGSTQCALPSLQAGYHQGWLQSPAWVQSPAPTDGDWPLPAFLSEGCRWKGTTAADGNHTWENLTEPGTLRSPSLLPFTPSRVFHKAG